MAARTTTPPPQFFKDGDKCTTTREIEVRIRGPDAQPYLGHVVMNHTLPRGSQVAIDGPPVSALLTKDNEPLSTDSVRYRFKTYLTIWVYEEDGAIIEYTDKVVSHSNLSPVTQTVDSSKAFRLGAIVSLKQKAFYPDKCQSIPALQLLKIAGPPVSPSSRQPVEKGVMLRTGVYRARKVKHIQKTFEVYNLDKIPQSDLTLGWN
ncbi:hypothetical protein H0H92_004941 [Tricholoma furcatifolium]|nr:hypothetical protein H0H92_004941 [Tricholoma furcatifolium]